ncbi:hypothetical protein MIND_01385600 [Mycena indigotica]|uniref:Uncharacterized protein n=1 Tax=Mycena indigotica TaxID=2126181 RepID=A0A8H6RZH7_9AGAR|nr:uncharacterized protein MIND_01385600 [Mycena indigotica]KAF7289241.1 hypothetical protein MIND_01385600 [Mycena indigotica]
MFRKLSDLFGYSRQSGALHNPREGGQNQQFVIVLPPQSPSSSQRERKQARRKYQVHERRVVLPPIKLPLTPGWKLNGSDDGWDSEEEVTSYSDEDSPRKDTPYLPPDAAGHFLRVPTPKKIPPFGTHLSIDCPGRIHPAREVDDPIEVHIVTNVDAFIRYWDMHGWDSLFKARSYVHARAAEMQRLTRMGNQRAGEQQRLEFLHSQDLALAYAQQKFAEITHFGGGLGQGDP